MIASVLTFTNLLLAHVNTPWPNFKLRKPDPTGLNVTFYFSVRVERIWSLVSGW